MLRSLRSLIKRARPSTILNSSVSGASIDALEELREEFEQKVDEAPKTRLPLNLPATEFARVGSKASAKNAKRGRFSFFDILTLDNKTSRIMNLAYKDVTDEKNVKVLVTSVTAVSVLAAIEGGLMVNLPLTDIYSHLLVANYSAVNVIPSCVWHTNEMAVVANSMGLPPSATLVEPGAGLKMACENIRSMRYIIATTTLIGQLFRFFSVSVRVSDAFGDNIRLGREPPFDNLNERVVRLAGQKSDVTVVSLERYGNHIFPIFEDPSKITYLVENYSNNLEKPVYWNVGQKSYGHKRTYSRLTIDDSWLLNCTSTGRRMLVCEADLVNEEDSLSLGRVSRDLTIDDASGAFREISSRAKECMKTKNYRFLRVVLGDSTEIFHSGGGHSQTLRDKVLTDNEADLIVDSRAPVLLSVLSWFEKNGRFAGEGGPGNGEGGELLFFTDSKEYFNNLKEILEPFGINVVDGFITLGEKKEAGEGVKGLVHFTTTNLTVNNASALSKRKKLRAVGDLCVLVDKPLGIRQMEDVMGEGVGGEFQTVIDTGGEGERTGKVTVICSSVVHDELLRSVRMWSRMGFSPASIQEELDFQFAKILHSEAAVGVEHQKEISGKGKEEG